MTLAAEPEPQHHTVGEISDETTIREELRRVVESSFFRTSRRYPALLKYVVETTLAGRSEELKERTIGVEVFNRDLTYDTNVDPVVRVTAAEVRKRLQQYYEEPAHQNEIRIELISGSYIPHFSAPSTATPEKPAPEPVSHNSSSRWIGIAALLLIVLLATAGFLWSHNRSAQTSINRLWAPFFHRTESVLICVGPMPIQRTHANPQAPTPDMGLVDALHNYNIIPLTDAVTLSHITSLMGANGQSFRVMNSEITTFDELQNGPVVLIGALNNQWTTRLTSRLRFQFSDSKEISRILDSQAKVQPDWVLYPQNKYSTLVQDYAVIARYDDPTTGRTVLIGGGIGPNGTLAAGDFLTSEQHLKELFDQAPSGWKGKNVEAVIHTEVINGNSGPPSIVATNFW